MEPVSRLFGSAEAQQALSKDLLGAAFGCEDALRPLVIDPLE